MDFDHFRETQGTPLHFTIPMILMNPARLCKHVWHGFGGFPQKTQAPIWPWAGPGGGGGRLGDLGQDPIWMDCVHFRKTQGTPLHFTIFMISDEFRSAM